MFDSISSTYDHLNRLLSFGIDRKWRKSALTYLDESGIRYHEILDVATGTGDLAIQAATRFPDISVYGIDLSERMIEIGRKKAIKKGLQNRIIFSIQDAEHLHFESNKFDSVVIAFGIRNFEHLNKGLSEMIRVLKPEGKMIIVEFSKPLVFPIKQIFTVYFKYILPFIGNMLSRDNRAYSYLFESVQQFPDYGRLQSILEQEGLRDCFFKPLTFGICTIYVGTK